MKIGMTALVAIVFLLAIPVYPVTTLGMLGYWKFEGNAGDGSGYGHNGTLRNHPVFTAGRVGRCLALQDRGYVAMDNSGGRLTVHHSVTVETWIKAAAFPKGHSYIYWKANSHALSVLNGNIAIKGTGGWWKPEHAPLRPGRWYHIAWTYDGSFSKVFIDGKELKSISAPGTLSPGGDVTVGHPEKGFKGFIDELKVYDRALTPAEIKSSYYEGLSLAGYWPLDGHPKDHGQFRHDGVQGENARYEGSIAGLGLELSGNNGDITLKHTGGGPELSKEVTMTAWIRLNTTGSGHIYEKTGSHALSVVNGKPVMTCAGEAWSPGNITLEIGRWYFLAGSYDGRRKKFFINGKEVAGEAQTGQLPPGGHTRLGNAAGEFNAVIDEVKVYNKAIPCDVLKQNYLDMPQPVAIWSFDNNALDRSGYNHHGKLINGPRYTRGKVNQCLYFDGNNDYILANNDDRGLDFIWIVTIEAWIKGERFTNEYQHIYDKYGALSLSVKDGKLALGGRGGWWFPPSTRLETHRWYHVAGTFGQGEKRIYIDGVLKDSIPIKNVVKEGDAAYISQPYFTFNGLIDELKIYNCPLSARDVLLRYQAGNLSGNR